jgi:hypothetical protein
MKTIIILILIVLVGASVFTYIYTKDTEKMEAVSNRDSIKLPTFSTNGLNPEHGLPGHRCDLPVGAPLTISAEKKSSAPVSPKTNPQHGMPGHRCDLAVGAPL